MKKIFFLILFVLSAFGGVKAQEYCFSQYYLDKLAISPAFATIGDYSEIGMIFRDQWPGIEGGFKIYNAEYQQKLPTYNSGIGVRLFGNSSGGGAFSTTEADFVYAYDFSLTYAVKCAFGIQAGYHTKKLNQTNLVYYSMINPDNGKISPLNENIKYDRSASLNFSGGMIFYTQRTVLAFGLYRMTNFVLTGEKNILPVMLTGIVNHKIKLASRAKQNKIQEIFIAPTLNFSRTSLALMIMPGAYFYGDKISAGLAYRFQKSGYNASSLVLSTGFNFGKIEIGIGYDIYLSAVGLPSKNSMEAGVKYKFENSEKNNGSKTILCPAF